MGHDEGVLVGARVPLLCLVLVLGGCAGGTPADGPSPGPTPDASDPSPSSAPRTAASSPGAAPTVVPAPTLRLPQHRLDAALRQAAWQDDVARARRLVRQGADVNAKDETQQSAYLIATSEGYLRLLRLTLANGARLNDKDSFNGTGLIRAAERGHGYVVGRLLWEGIDADHVNRLGYQALHEAVWLGEDTPAYHTTVRVLVAGGVPLRTASGREGLTPLQMADRRGYAGSARILRHALSGPSPSDPDRALLRSARRGRPDQAAVALRAGADPEARDGRGRTPLLLATSRDRGAVARLLAAVGADPDAAVADGVTALEHARRSGQDTVVRVLRGR